MFAPYCQNSTTLAQIGDEIWHVDEPERLRRLAQFAPHLMTYEEQKIWAVLGKNGTFWFGEWRPLNETKEYYSYDAEPRKMYMRAVEDHWDQIKKIAAGEVEPQYLFLQRTVRFKGGSLTLDRRSFSSFRIGGDMSVKFQKLTRLIMRRTLPGQVVTEHGITFGREPDGDGVFSVNIMVDRRRIHRVIGRESEGVTRQQAEDFISQARSGRPP